MKTFILYVSLPLMVAACGNPSKNFKEGRTASRSEAIREKLNSEPMSEEQTEALRNTTFSEMHSLLLRGSSDRAYSIDGFQFQGVRSQLELIQPAFEAIENRYGTIGEYLDANSVSLDVKVSEAALTETLLKASDFVNDTGIFGTLKAKLLQNPTVLRLFSPDAPDAKDDQVACDAVAGQMSLLGDESKPSLISCAKTFSDSILGTNDDEDLVNTCKAAFGADVLLSTVGALNNPEMCKEVEESKTTDPKKPGLDSKKSN